MKEMTRSRVRFLAGFAVYFGVLWLLWNTPVIYPLKIFVVLLHEISHGLVALATGGGIQRIVISAKEGGLCECPSRSPFLTLSAGYLGSLAWGALILLAARMRNPLPRVFSGVVGALVILITLLYVRNWFGLAFGLAFGAGLIVVARELPTYGITTLLTGLGLTSCLYAILDIKSDIIDRPEVLSDARMLAQLTGVPTIIWGFLWIGVALLVSWWLFRYSFRRSSQPVRGRDEVFHA